MGLTRNGASKTNVGEGLKEGNRNLSESFSEHRMSAVDLRRTYSESNINAEHPTQCKGLTSHDAAQLLAKNGPNLLPPPKQVSNIVLFLRQFVNVLWLLMLTASFLSLVGYITDPSVYDNLIVFIIMLVMIVVFCFGQFLQERKALQAIKGFANLLPLSCTAIRDGREQTTSVESLVIGDIIVIKSGERVPADARILYSAGCKLETSSITGEPEPIEFNAEAVDTNVNVFESNNVAFNGSFCVDGEAVAVVIRTGKDTIIGQIASMTSNQRSNKSSLEMEIIQFVKFLAVMAITLGSAAFITGAIVNHGHRIVYLAVNGFLVIIIANVPNGFPATVVSQLTIITRQMAAKNVFLKRLDIVEAFGATTIVASDKTGTLTKNKMTVTDLWYNLTNKEGLLDAKPSGNRNDLVTLFDDPLPDLLTVMCACNKAQFADDDEKGGKTSATDAKFKNSDVEKGTAIPTPDRKTMGSPSEVAMILFGDKMFSIKELRSRFPPVFEIPFNSKRKWHLQIVKISANRGETLPPGHCKYKVMMKGAPEILIKKCTKIASAEGDKPLDDKIMAKFQAQYDHYAANGRRVIGFIQAIFTAPENSTFEQDGSNYPQKEMTFLGMTAIMDPPRDETADAVHKCKTAGIKVFMVTGDHPATASAIARQIGLIGPPDEPKDKRDWDVCHGDKISSLTDEQWDDLLSHKYLVFGRTTPEQKLLIVEQCQKRDEIITMTGDGVNDAPALKRANIGVAMGLNGSDVAKQAADIVLMDDNFASIVAGIERGRMLFDNLKKTIAYTLPHLWPEIYALLLNFSIGVPMGLRTLQILSIDLGTELGPGISLAYEAAERDIMKRKPRKRTNRLVSKGILAYAYIWAGNMISISSISAYLYVFWYHGINVSDLPHTTNNYWTADCGRNFTSNNRSFTPSEQVEILGQASAAWYIGIVFNQHTIGGTAIEMCLLCFFVYTPGVQTILGNRPPPILVWAFPVAMGAIMTACNEIRKFMIRTWPRFIITRAIKW